MILFLPVSTSFLSACPPSHYSSIYLPPTPTPKHEEALEKAQAEIQRLRVERGHYEDSMKKAFMRGVCALNMEALSMFHSGDGRSLELDPHGQYQDHG